MAHAMIMMSPLPEEALPGLPPPLPPPVWEQKRF